MRKWSQMQAGSMLSAHLIAASLWLHSPSMTDGYLVKMIPVEGDCGEMLEFFMRWMCDVRRRLRSCFHVG